MKINKLAIIASTATLAVASASFAASDVSTNPNAASGFFVGANAGLARANFGDTDRDLKQASNSSRQGGFGGGLFAGYHFNQYFDAQIGYIYIPTNKYKFTNGNIELKTHAFDILGKAYLPMAMVNPSLSHLSLYAKGGLAYVSSKMSATHSSSSIEVTKENTWEPIYGAGIAYSINQNAVLDLGWTQIYGPKNKNQDIPLKSPMVNMVTLGFTYRFTNLSA